MPAATIASAMDAKSPRLANPSVNSDDPANANASRNEECSSPQNIAVKPASRIETQTTRSASRAIGA